MKRKAKLKRKKRKSPIYLGLYANDDGDVVYVWEIAFQRHDKPGSECVVYTPVKLKGRMLRGDKDRVADWKGYDTQDDFLKAYPHRIEDVEVTLCG